MRCPRDGHSNKTPALLQPLAHRGIAPLHHASLYFFSISIYGVGCVRQRLTERRAAPDRDSQNVAPSIRGGMPRTALKFHCGQAASTRTRSRYKKTMTDSRQFTLIAVESIPQTHTHSHTRTYT